MTDLKACPHCGKTRWLKVFPIKTFDDAEGKYVDYGFAVCCSAAGWYAPGGEGTRGCGAYGGWGEDEAEAAEAWNRRTPPTAETMSPVPLNLPTDEPKETP